MGKITVRVVPRSSRSEVRVGPEGPVVHVRSAAEDGRANREAAAVLGAALGVPKSRVRLTAGARARTKVFEVEGASTSELEHRLHAS